jgi:D-alanyl-D-alanine carboxypeptidase/D-alanyl-D-alanine-endopeptidase (penicillin-binding protein 4)
MHIYDGSGLSPADRITPRTMVEQLVYASKQNWFPDFYRSLGIAGDPEDIGYFNHFGNGTPIANNARIKSGLISDVRSMSGYLHDKKGRLIVFSMIANNYDGHKNDVDNLYKKILIELADLH